MSLECSKITEDAEEFGRVAVLMGGASAEREVSLSSGRAVYAALQEAGINAFAIDVGDDPVAALINADLDRAFNVVHGKGGEDGVLQGVLQALKIPYTGSGLLGSALSMDKLASKRIWASEGLSTPRWAVLRSTEQLTQVADELGFPLMVKPASEGSSVGMSRVVNVEELSRAYAVAQVYGDVFAEQWIEGAEYTVGFLASDALPAIRLETPNAFYDYEAKYLLNTTCYHCPCGLTESREQEIQALALRAANAIGVSGWGRVDLMIDANNKPWLIEVNAVPGMTDHSLIPMAAKAIGLEMPQLVWRILETSMVTGV